MLNIKVKFVKNSKKLAPSTMGICEQTGEDFKVWILNTPDFPCTLAHEFGHIIQNIIQGIDAKEEELAEILEDVVRNWLRTK